MEKSLRYKQALDAVWDAESGTEKERIALDEAHRVGIDLESLEEVPNGKETS